MYLYLCILVACVTAGVVSQEEGQFMRGHKPASQHRTKLRGWPPTCVACATPPPSLPGRGEAHGLAASCSSVPHAVVHEYFQGKWAKSDVAPTFQPAVRMHGSTESNAALPEQVCKQLGNWQIAPELYHSTALCCAADNSGALRPACPFRTKSSQAPAPAPVCKAGALAIISSTQRHTSRGLSTHGSNEQHLSTLGLFKC